VELETTLLAAVSDLSSVRDLPGVTRVVRVAARTLTGADGVTFVLKDVDQCFYADEDAISPLWKGRRFPLHSCISGWVMRHRIPVAIKDIYSDDRIPHDAYRPTFVKSMLMVPVRTEDPVAAIGAYWADEHEATEEERSTLESLATAASLALVNVQLWSDLTRALAREQQARVEAEHAREVAERASRLKDQFLSTVSHELRTPLNVMQGWLWQLDRGLPSPDRFKLAVSTLQRNTALQTQLVEDLLDVSRAISGKLRLEVREVNVADVVRTAIETVRPAMAAKGLRFEAAYDPDLPLITADPDRLQQIVWNLVSNAIKFTPEGGSIAVSVARAAAGVELTVRDSGAGIAPDFLPHAFERFRQADTGTRRRYGGLGLGLAIVRHLAEMHGGTVVAESEGEGRGATFRVRLPVSGRPAGPGGEV